jgi:hypothetical protein
MTGGSFTDWQTCPEQPPFKQSESVSQGPFVDRPQKVPAGLIFMGRSASTALGAQAERKKAANKRRTGEHLFIAIIFYRMRQNRAFFRESLLARRFLCCFLFERGKQICLYLQMQAPFTQPHKRP